MQMNQPAPRQCARRQPPRPDRPPGRPRRRPPEGDRRGALCLRGRARAAGAGLRLHRGSHHRPWTDGRDRQRRRRARAGRAAGVDARQRAEAGAVPTRGRRPLRPAAAVPCRRRVATTASPWHVVAETPSRRAPPPPLVQVSYEPARRLRARPSRSAPSSPIGRRLRPDSAVGDFDPAFAGGRCASTRSTRRRSRSTRRWSRTRAWPGGSGERLIVHCSTQFIDSAHQRVAHTLMLARGAGAHRQPLHRRRLRRQAAGLRRRDPRRAGRARARPPGEDGADAPADVPRHHAPQPHPPARAARRRPRGRAERHRPRSVGARHAAPRVLRAGGRLRPLALRRRPPHDAPPHRRARPAAGRFVPRARRGGRHAGAGKRDGRAGAPPGIDPIELRRRNEPVQDPEKHMPYSTRQLVACMEEGARRFGWAQRHARARPGARRPLADRHRHERGEPRQPPERIALPRSRSGRTARCGRACR